MNIQIDQTTKERESFFYYFSYVGIIAATLFAVINISNGKTFIGIIELLCGLTGIYNLIRYKKLKNYTLATSTILIIMFVLLSILFVTGGLESTGIFWIYTFPILSFFLKGKKEGVYWIVGLWAILITLTLLSLKTEILNIPYSLIEIRQLFASFFAVSVMVYFYEKTVSNYKKSIEDKNRELSSLNNSLEEKVVEEIKRRDVSEKMFSSIFNNSPVGIGIFNKDGSVKDLNPQASKILNFSNDSTFNRDLFQDVRESHKEFQSLQDGKIDSYSVLNSSIAVNNKEIPIEMNVFSIRNKEKKVENIVRFFSDISLKKSKEEKEKQQENLLMQQSRMASLGELLGDISHQWRQPLNTLGLSLQTVDMHLDDEPIDKPFIKKTIDNSMDNIESMSRTIDNFIEYFKPENEKNTFDVIKTINSSLEVLKGNLTEGDISVQTEYQQSKISYYGYQTGLKQAVLHILKNAVDAIELNNPKEKQISIFVKDYNKELSIIIEDSGGGVKQEILNKVFDPYFTTKHKSRDKGISLYMTKMIIEKNMNGTIELKNTTQGALISITFPKI